MRDSRAPWDGKRTRQISQFLPRSKKHPRKSHIASSPSLSRREASKASMKVRPEGRDGGREEGQNAGIKNPQKPKAFTLVFNGCDWTVGFRGGLKWRSRRNGKTHQNEIQDSDRPWRRRESLEKIRIYFISLSARIHKRFFSPFPPSPPFLRARVSPLDDHPTGHLLATRSVSSVTWKSYPLFSRDIKAEFIKICAIKAT